MGVGVPVTQTEMKLGHPDLRKEWVMGGRGMSLSPGRPRAPRRRNGRIRLGGLGRGQAADTSKPARLPAPSPLISGSISGCAALQKPPSLLPAPITPSRWRSPPQGRYRRPGATPHTLAGVPPGAERGLGGPHLASSGRVDGWGDPDSGILELPLEERTAWGGTLPLGSWSCLWKSGRLGGDPDSGILKVDRALGKGCSGQGGKAENLDPYRLSGLIRRNGARRDPRVQKAGNPERSSLVVTPCGEARTPGSERGGGEGWRG